MGNLTRLNLQGNQVNDVSALTGLAGLRYLNLSANQINDISPLLLSNLKSSLNYLSLKGNNLDLNYSTYDRDLQEFAGKSIDMEYEPQRNSAALYNYNVSVYVDGKQLNFPDQKAFIDNSIDRIFVPVRLVSEALNARVDYEQGSQKIVISKDDKKVTLFIGNRDADVNGYCLVLESPPVLMNDRTMVTLKFIIDSLNLEAQWLRDKDGGCVKIWSRHSNS